MLALRHPRHLLRTGLAGLLCSALLLTAASAKTFNVVEATVSDIQSAILARELTARQLVQLYLDRIEAYDQKGPSINCVISLNPAALAEADKLDAAFAKTGKLTGPMHGVVVLVKDEIDAAGMATTQGVAVFANYRPPLDAFVVGKLRKEGAIILGKTTLSEYAAVTPTPPSSATPAIPTRSTAPSAARPAAPAARSPQIFPPSLWAKKPAPRSSAPPPGPPRPACAPRPV